MKYLLDTHTWVWWNARPEALSAGVKRTLSRLGNRDEVLLSAISVWELCKLIEHGRLALSYSVEDWIEEALDMPKLRLVQLTPKISYHSTVLPGEFHADPADQIIAATARVEKAVILTKDDRILNYQYVQSRW